mgnify:CR=1 FL=1
MVSRKSRGWNSSNTFTGHKNVGDAVILVNLVCREWSREVQEGVLETLVAVLTLVKVGWATAIPPAIPPASATQNRLIPNPSSSSHLDQRKKKKNLQGM